MTVDEVKILLSDLNRGYNTPYSSAEQATIERLYYEVLGKRLSGCRCPDRWHDAVLEINSYIKKHGKMKEKSNYKLRAGVILQIAGSSEIYTNDNLTDEVAADEHEVRCAQHAEGFHGDVNQGLGGADAVHIGSKAAGRHNQKADAGALLGGNGFERIEDVKEHES